jgi:hypothetical protein
MPYGQELVMMKALFYGAGAAALIGLAAGAAIKDPIWPGSSVGQQQLISEPRQRALTAVDSWAPTEGAPPPALTEADWGAPNDHQIELALARMPIFASQREPVAEPRPAEVAHNDLPDAPQPYLPSARGDILAPAAYVRPPDAPAPDGEAGPGPEPGRDLYQATPAGLIQTSQSDYH